MAPARSIAHLLFAALTIALVASTFPATNAQTTLLDLPVAIPYETSFDTPADWTASPIPPPTRPAPTSTWAWGTPTSGPGVAASGTRVWATNLSGSYINNDCGGLASPPIDLTGATAASVSFKQWRHIEESTLTTGTAFDGGLLFVTADGGATFTKVTPAGGYTSKNLSATARTCLDAQPTGTKGLSGPAGTTPPPATYTTLTTDLSAFAGQTVQFVIAFGSDGSVTRAGWYVDDVSVTIDGVTTTEDFEASNGGFTVIGTKVPPPGPNGWSWGTPSNGPGPVSTMWATNPTGNYGPSECSWVESPMFKLSDVPADAAPLARATLSWKQWFKASSISAGGVVQIGHAGTYTNVKPLGGYGGNATSSLNACLQDDTQASGAFVGTLNPTPAMTDQQADVVAWLGEEISIRFLFASTTSTATQEGWYVDDIFVDVALHVEAPDEDDISPGDDAPFWTSGGVAKSWAYGVASTGPVGETVYKTNLNGNHNANECSFIDSPSVPGAAVAAIPTLKFDQWYKMESIFSTTSYDGGVVLVSADEGATWAYLPLAEYDRATAGTILKSCLASHGVAGTSMLFSGNATAAFETVTGDLSAYTGASSVKVRFLFGSDGSVQYDGWAIKNVEIGGVKVL